MNSLWVDDLKPKQGYEELEECVF